MTNQFYEEEGIRAMNEDQSLTLSLSTLLHPSVFSCFSPMRKTGGGSRDEGIRFCGGRDGKGHGRRTALGTVVVIVRLFSSINLPTLVVS